jgi:hypothetical protein
MRKLRLTPFQIKKKVRERTNARIEALFSEEDNEQQRIDEALQGITEDFNGVKVTLETATQKIDVIIYLVVLLLISIVLRFI